MSLLLAVEALGFGALIGLSLGALGAGGSILTVPILVYVVGVPVQSAAGTSLAIVGLNAAAGAADYLRWGRSLPRTGIAFGLSGLLGALTGAWLNHVTRADLVLALFAVLMLGAAWSLVRRRAEVDSGRFTERYTPLVWLRLAAVGMVIGVLTGFFGVGGGFLMVPLQMLLTRVRQVEANATSLAAVIPISIAAVFVYTPRVDLTFAALLMAGSVAGAYAGARLSGRIPERALQIIVAVVLGVLGLKELAWP